MRTHRIFPSLALALSLVGLGCESDSTDPEQPAPECHDPSTPGCVVTSDKQRITDPNVSASDLQELSDGNTAFALDMYQRLRTRAGNLFYSPYSMSSALAMTYAGARGETEQQMAGALRFTLPQGRLHPAFNGLDQALASRGHAAEGQDGEGFRLNVANAIWGQIAYPFEAPFLDVLGESYGAGLHVVDFVSASEQARDIINGWVAKRTEDRIKEILPQGVITSDTRLVLTNAIYFNAAWEVPFKEASTGPGDFTRQDGSIVSVPMMKGWFDMRYGEGDGYAALEMPYDGHELSMVLVLPSDLDSFEASLDSALLSGVIGSLGARGVDVRLPRFKFESSLDLKEPLSDLGMSIAFSGAADFSGISGKGGLSISDVLHKAFVSVNEAGTEAAAATAVIVGETSAPEPASIQFDRPFLFLIRDIQTGAILFFGRVSDPST